MFLFTECDCLHVSICPQCFSACESLATFVWWWPSAHMVHLLVFLCAVWDSDRCSLLNQWFFLTRLEIRTTESSTCASSRVASLKAEWRWLLGIGTSNRPINWKKFEFEHVCQNPKDGELCLRRAKSEKLWWRLIAVLTRKSFVIRGYRGFFFAGGCLAIQ